MTSTIQGLRNNMLRLISLVLLTVVFAKTHAFIPSDSLSMGKEHIEITDAHRNNKEDKLLDSINFLRKNYYRPLRDESYKNLIKPKDQYTKKCFFRDISLDGTRNYYVVDTLHLSNYYILIDKKNNPFIITDKRILNKFDFENPLNNKNCYLTNSGYLICNPIGIYFYGPIAMSGDLFWPYTYGKTEKLPHGYTLHNPADKNTVTDMHHIFAVILVKGSLYNQVYLSEVPFIDDNSYYIMLMPIFKDAYEYFYDSLLIGNFKY